MHEHSFTLIKLIRHPTTLQKKKKEKKRIISHRSVAPACIYRFSRSRWTWSWSWCRTRLKNMADIRSRWLAWASSRSALSRSTRTKDWTTRMRGSVPNIATRRKSSVQKARRKAATASQLLRCTGGRVGERFRRMPGYVKGISSALLSVTAYCIEWLLFISDCCKDHVQ